ncbi:MAG: glutamine--fructose-6-phosphate transaminase (isomerizing) [Cytophagales bacterium]|jgi:glucosamine--fructose-6-phosphate aminotransferase (isomerizing)|nr:glutamine--fructose-6-phosphate transaminase (isomerizing) [Nitrosomonadales bacterium]|tara:strand:- start:23 stop:1873 length:1851 start_codon:yes stop_codon:yes gene_type:complete
MCGIVSYIGNKNALPIILEGLQRLEYRGYDSAGIFIRNEKEDKILRVADKVKKLRKLCREVNTKNIYTFGMGHTRWATHGKPNEQNAHPHQSNNGELIMIHNGIIENYETLKTELLARGYTFKSDTDSEVLINLFEEIQKTKNLSLEETVKIGLNRVVGAYGIVVYDKKRPDFVVAAKLGSPLAIGLGENEFYIGSDATPFIEYTKKVIYLNDFEMTMLQPGTEVKVRNIKEDSFVKVTVKKLDLNLENIQKGGYDHFMLKEIYEQPKAIENALRGRINHKSNSIELESVIQHKTKFIDAKRIIILGCGTSWHAGLVGEYMIEKITRIPTEVEYASEFRYRDPIIQKGDIVIPISQSGETADTMAALKIAKERGAFIYGICNVVGSSISRETNSGIYTHAGPEIGVASTKAFTTQITVLMLLALKIGQLRNSIGEESRTALINELQEIPLKIEVFLKEIKNIESIAKQYHRATNMLYLGRGFNFPVALEGALKLKEISYIHAEGYPAAEMKHGPIALIDNEMPVIVIATKKGHYEKIVSNIHEIKSRNGKIIAIVTKGDKTLKNMANHSIEIPESSEFFTPLFATIPLQLLSYHIALLRECNVDQPRNLAKSVTVE